MMDAADAVAVEKMGAPRVEEQVPVTSEEPRSRPSHLQEKRRHVCSTKERRGIGIPERQDEYNGPFINLKHARA